MSDAPKRGRGRPPKRTAAEKQRRKAEYNLARYHRLKSKPPVESTEDEPATAPTLASVGPTTIPIVESAEDKPTTTPTLASVGPTTIPTDLSGLTAPIEDSIPPISDNESLPNFQFEDNDLLSASSSSSDYGGHIVDGSGGGHIDEDIYRVSDGDHTVDGSGGGHIDEDIYGVSDGDQEVQRLPKETTEFQDQGQGFQDDLDYQGGLGEEDIDQLAAHLGKQSLKSPKKSRSKSRTAKPADLVANSAADSAADSAAGQLEVASRLAEQFYSFHGCTDDAHDACDAEYTQS
jgi:hypothetical protein